MDFRRYSPYTTIYYINNVVYGLVIYIIINKIEN